MPGVIRKLLVFAAVDGLVLQPIGQRNQRPAAPLKIDYKSHKPRPLLRDITGDIEREQDASFEVQGVIGVLKVASSAYLISVSRKKQVAQVYGKPIYAITGIAIIPITSREEAKKAIAQAREDRKSADLGEKESENLAFGEDSDTLSTGDSESLEEHNNSKHIQRSRRQDHRRSPSSDRRDPGIAEEVINNKGVYGRFTERWFSKRGWNVGLPGRSRSLSGPSSKEAGASAGYEVQTFGVAPDMVTDEAYQRWPQTPAQTSQVEKPTDDAFPGMSGPTLTSSLLPKLLQTTKVLLSTGTFFFSYDYDVTRSLAFQSQTSSDLPLARQVESQYFYNQHLAQPLADEGFLEFVLPVMQGFVGQRAFSLRPEPEAAVTPPLSEGAKPPADVVEVTVQSSHDNPLDPTAQNSSDFLVTLISRRSARRAGLRYLRRGIDDEGNVANAVETEQILSSPSWGAQQKVYSFLQTRGSIPVFFSQMPYTFKPPPQLHASPEDNQAVMRKHFSTLAKRYGGLQAVSLVDKHGPEVQIGEAYESYVEKLNESGGINGSPINFEWFEFHNACKGMRFENVSFLVDSMTPFIVASSFSTLQGSTRITAQSGIVRTNCMDCLDRTNVVQSALAQFVLSKQLADQGFSINLSTDASTTWFNTLWADNGDAISKAYTGTSALKGDYTRTRKRNAFGALTDLSLTLTRYYHNLFNDFFAQAVIDYLLGSVNEAVFAEFEEHMATSDPAIDLQKARQSAIDAATNVVIGEHEDLLHAWVMQVPAISGTLRTFPFGEALLMLTDIALYVVHFDWEVSKVRSFERIELERINGLQTGVYITETHTPRQIDPERNVGLSIRYLTPQPADGQKHSLLRVNTRSLDNSITDSKSTTVDTPHGECRELVFKALPAGSSATTPKKRTIEQLGERGVVEQVAQELRSAIEKTRARNSPRTAPAIEEKDILSLQEARKSTGYVESLAFSVKKAIWG